MFDQVDRHLRKLDQELAKFKMELEADNAGITEILERRELLLILCFCEAFEISGLTFCAPLDFLRVFRDGQSNSASQQPSCPLSHHH